MAATVLVVAASCGAAIGVLAWRSDDAQGGAAAVATTTTTTTAPSTTTTAGPSTTTTAPGPAAITLAFGGDVLLHGPVNDQAAAYGAESGTPYDYRPMFAPLAGVVGGADVALCHMEVPVTPDGRITSYPSFGSPAEVVAGVGSAGYDGCSTASNHSLDRGFAGVTATLDAFDANGLGHAGTARSAEEGAAIRTYDLQGVTVAHLSYAYGFNGYQVPADAPFAANQIDPARIRADAARAVVGGAQLVVVSLHFGNEYQHEPSTYQREVVADLLTSRDIGLVIGHHAHVVQPISRIDQRYVVWGLGNQLSNQTQDPRTDGLTVVVTAEPGVRGPEHRWVVSGIEAVPTWVDRPSFRVLPVVPALADPATAAGLRADLLASYDRTVAVALAERPVGVTVAPRPAG
jgi:hypothetical protein